MYTDTQVSSPVAVMNNLIGHVIHVLGTVCFISGAIMVLMAFYQYTEHRRNPLVVPLTKVIMLLAIGAALMCFQYIPIQG